MHTYSQLKGLLISDLSPPREQLCDEVYSHLEKQCGGQVLLQDLARLYHPAKDPMVLNHSMTEGQVFSEFMKLWRT